MAHYSDKHLAEFVAHRRQRALESNKKSIGMGTMKSSDSAEILAQFDAAAARLTYLAGLTPRQLQFLEVLRCPEGALLPEAETKAVAPPVRYRTGEQYTTITKLLNHSCFTVAERTHELLRINTLLEADAPAAIAALQQQVPTPEQVAAVQTQLARSCFTDEARTLGASQLAETKRAGMPHLLTKFTKLADELTAGLASASSPAQAAARPATPAPSTHPALVATPYEQARQELTLLLRSEHVTDEERTKAGLVIAGLSEAELREKTKIVRRAITGRQTKLTAAA